MKYFYLMPNPAAMAFIWIVRFSFVFYSLRFWMPSLHASDVDILVGKVESVEQGNVVKMEWRAPASKIASLPQWSLKDGILPLSLDKALKIGLNEVQRQFPNITIWRLSEAHLLKIMNEGKPDPKIKDKYYYLIEFVPANDADLQSLKQQKKEDLLTQVVLLDGTILEGKETIRKLGE